MFLRKPFSSSEFDDTIVIILEKECLIDDRSIVLFLEEFVTIPLLFIPIIDKQFLQ